MTTTVETPRATPDKPIRAPWKAFFGMLAFSAVVFTVYRIYQHETAFTFGLDYFNPEFATYWMSVLYAELAIEVLLGAAIVGYLWTTRDRHLDKITPAEELRRYLVLMSQLLLFGAIAYVVTSIYTESDAAWHQVTVRDTDFTPTHIGLFYFGVPVFILSVLTAFVYARTRIPAFASKVSLPFALLVAGPVMIMPNLGFNEWGHTFFYAEELFAAPIHWGFVLLGWATFAAGGLLVQILSRIVQLTQVIGSASAQQTDIQVEAAAKAELNAAA
ncbi:MAG: methane monooxygenase/ammonia monooxygenase subunit C [Nevskiales bacterium]|nr:methane monooxygenase/ammonia monooxygenase subunit C [Nevskiales bacterium]